MSKTLSIAGAVVGAGLLIASGIALVKGNADIDDAFLDTLDDIEDDSVADNKDIVTGQ